MYSASDERELLRAFSASCRVSRPPGALDPSAILVAAQRLAHFRTTSSISCYSVPPHLLLNPQFDQQHTLPDDRGAAFQVSWRSNQHNNPSRSPGNVLVSRIAATLLQQLQLCSTAQAAKTISALTSDAAAAAQLPADFAVDFAANVAIDDGVFRSADTEVTPSQSSVQDDCVLIEPSAARPCSHVFSGRKNMECIHSNAACSRQRWQKNIQLVPASFVLPGLLMQSIERRLG
jgi:hypothetical protein